MPTPSSATSSTSAPSERREAANPRAPLSVIIVLFISIPIGAILGLVAVGVGNYGRQQAGTRGGMPLAIAGMVLGWASVALQLVAAIAD